MDLLKKVLEENKLRADCFLYKLITQQLLCLAAGDCRAFRWDKDIVLWALTLQYHGGKLVIDRIRGKGSEGLGNHGHLEIDPKNWNLFLPANSTLRSYLPHVDCYQGVSVDLVTDIKQAIASKSVHDGDTEITAGISFDEMEIKSGLVYFKRTGQLIGTVDGILSEKNVGTLNWIKLRSQLATHVFQLFITTTDGSACFPLGFFPSGALKGKRIFEIIKSIKEVFEDPATGRPISIKWTSSDGFSSNRAYLDLLKKK